MAWTGSIDYRLEILKLMGSNDPLKKLRILALLFESFRDYSRSASSYIRFEEEEGYQDGMALPEELWFEEGVEAEIESPLGSKTGQMLVVKGDGFLETKLPGTSLPGPGFLTFHIRPTVTGILETGTRVNAVGARIGFLSLDNKEETIYGAEILIQTFDNETETDWIHTGVLFELNREMQSAVWLRITIRSEPESQIWDFFYQGELILADLPLFTISETETSSFVLYPGKDGEAHLDEMSVMAYNPLFADFDRDAIPDEFELSNGFDPMKDDRHSRLTERGPTLLDLFLGSVEE